MIIPEKTLKLDICALNGYILFTCEDNYVVQDENEAADSAKLLLKGVDLPVIPKNSQLKLVQHKMTGDRVAYNGTVDLSTDRQLNLHISFESNQTLEERRRFFKAETDLPCEIISLMRDERALNFSRSMVGRIKNLNIGGVFVLGETLLQFAVDDILTLRVPDIMGERFDVSTRILRVQPGKDGKEFGYGCQFLSLDSRQEDLIARYINRLQTELRDKKLKSDN